MNTKKTEIKVKVRISDLQTKRSERIKIRLPANQVLDIHEIIIEKLVQAKKWNKSKDDMRQLFIRNKHQRTSYSECHYAAMVKKGDRFKIIRADSYAPSTLSSILQNKKSSRSATSSTRSTTTTPPSTKKTATALSSKRTSTGPRASTRKTPTPSSSTRTSRSSNSTRTRSSYYDDSFDTLNSMVSLCNDIALHSNTNDCHNDYNNHTNHCDTSYTNHCDNNYTNHCDTSYTNHCDNNYTTHCDTSYTSHCDTSSYCDTGSSYCDTSGF